MQITSALYYAEHMECSWAQHRDLQAMARSFPIGVRQHLFLYGLTRTPAYVYGLECDCSTLHLVLHVPYTVSFAPVSH